MTNFLQMSRWIRCNQLVALASIPRAAPARTGADTSLGAEHENPLSFSVSTKRFSFYHAGHVVDLSASELRQMSQTFASYTAH